MLWRCCRCTELTATLLLKLKQFKEDKLGRCAPRQNV
jgi:hypothetical protein